MSKRQEDQGWVGPFYTTTDPVAASRLQGLLEDRGVPAILQTRHRGNTGTVYLDLGRPMMYQVLISSKDGDAHQEQVAAALAEVRQELGQENEVW
ncbi:MAG TPA: hypothetical protein VGM19_06495 [Armatimonadota bacterium]